SPTPPPAYGATKPGTDADLVSAAEALTQLTNASSPGSATAGSSPVPTYTDASTGPPTPSQHPLITQVNQVTKHPIVTNALKYYETSKRNYAPFNYAAEIVEKAAIPVVNKIEVNLNNRHQARKLRREQAAAAAAAEKTDDPESRSKKRRLAPDDAQDETVSIETKKRLQFCLHILRLANDHINNSVSFLQQKVADKEKSIKEERENLIQKQQEKQQEEKQQLDFSLDNKIQADIPSDAALQTKTEIATTVKKIIHLISNFKPSSLSTEGLSPVSSNATVVSQDNGDLKATIRDIILKLPSTIQQSALSNTTSSQTNDKIFVFAKESLDMISKLTNVFNEQLVRAETWVGGE
ncbi:uncharacterized protein CANTADRAFT_31480, partial [Suhomyces tanzawaensis NRRL Y-17324]